MALLVQPMLRGQRAEEGGVGGVALWELKKAVGLGTGGLDKLIEETSGATIRPSQMRAPAG